MKQDQTHFVITYLFIYLFHFFNFGTHRPTHNNDRHLCHFFLFEIDIFVYDFFPICVSEIRN